MDEEATRGSADLETVLVQVCAESERLLAAHPKMKVEEKSRSVLLECKDTSGSTAVLALVSATEVVVANVGRKMKSKLIKLIK